MPRKQQTLPAFEPGHGFSREDWDAVDSPELTEAELAQAKPFKEAFPEDYARIKGPGRPRLDRPKVNVTLRLDQEVVEKFRASGRGWQSRINEILKKAAL